MSCQVNFPLQDIVLLLREKISPEIIGAVSEEKLEEEVLLFIQPKIDELQEQLTKLPPEVHVVTQSLQEYVLETTLNNGKVLTSDLAPLFVKFDGLVSLYEKNVVAGAGTKGWAADLVVYDGLTQKQINDGLESIATMLAIKNPRNGQRVYVKSYHAGKNKGGGTFVYDSSKANINDNVSVINGWMRDLSSKTLTTDDVGLKGDGTDTDATLRLQQLASAVQDGFTVLLIGKYTINRHIVFYKKNNVKVFGVNSDIQGDPNNWIWDTTNVLPDIPWYHPSGLIKGIDCPNLEISGLKITGIRRNSHHPGTDTWEDGDSGIFVIRCNDCIIYHNSITNVFAWGIAAVQSKNAKIYENNISKVIHQSGINAVSQSDGGTAHVYNNTINDVGLYGIEYESVKPFSTQCYGNIINGSWAGIMFGASSNEVSGVINANKISNTLYGGFMTNNTNVHNDLIFSNNPISNSQYGLVVGNTSGFKFANNKLSGRYTEEVLQHLSSLTFIAQILAPNQFLIQQSFVSEFGAKIGTEWYANDTKFTITNVELWGGQWQHGNKLPDDWFYKITIAENILDDDYLFIHVKRKFVTNSGAVMGISVDGKNTNNEFTANNIDGYQYGIEKRGGSTTDVNYTERFINNIITKSSWAGILQTDYYPGVSYINNYLDIDNSNIHRDVYGNGNITLKDFKTINFAKSQEFPNTNPTETQFFIEKEAVIKAVTLVPISGNTTGNLIVTINGQSFTASSPGVYKTIGTNNTLNRGSNTIKVTDTVGDLVYNDMYVTFKTL